MRTAVRLETAPPEVTAVEIEETDAELVVRAQRDRLAFAPLYDRYAGPVFRYCFASLGNREDAEDATSQIFARAIAGLPRCQPDRFRSWLFSIAHNVIVDRFRWERSHSPLEEAHAREDNRPLPEELAISNDSRDRIFRLLETIPADQRRVIELRLAGLSGVEIAGLLGRSHAAVKMLQARAIARLKKGLADGAA